MDYGALIGMVAQLAGSAVGTAMSQMDMDKAMALIKASVDEYGKINVPVLQKLALSKNPDTLLAQIKDDPQYRQQQMDADAQMSDLIQSGGLTLSDKAALDAIRNKTAASDSANRQTTAEDFRRRGQLGSGAELAMDLKNQQNSAQSLNASGDAMAGNAQARAYQAIIDRAKLAGQGLDRSYNQQANAARAQDTINAGNTAIANTATTYNNQIPQQDFNNQITLANGRMKPNEVLAGLLGANAKNTQGTANGIGNIISTGVQKLGSGQTQSGQGGADTGYDNPTYSDAGSFSLGDSGGEWNDLGSSFGELGSSSTRPAHKVENGVGYTLDPATGKYVPD